MSALTLDRILPLSGIGAVALLVIGATMTASSFAYWITPEEALAGFTKNPARIQTGTVIGGFYAVPLFVIFAGALVTALAAAEGQRSPLPTVAFAGAILCAIALALGPGVLWVAATRAGRPGGVSAEYAVIFNDLYSVLLATVASLGFAALIGATGVASLRTGLFPTWVGWASVVFGIGLLTPIHWIFEGLSLVWIVVISVLLFLQG